MSKVKLGTVIDTCLGKMLDAAKNKGDYEPYLANLNVRWGDFELDNLSLMRFETQSKSGTVLNLAILLCAKDENLVGVRFGGMSFQI